MNPGDRTPLRCFCASESTGPLFFDLVIAVPRQRCHHVNLVPSADKPLDNAGHHSAGRSGIGREVRAEDDDLHAVSTVRMYALLSADPDASRVKPRARAEAADTRASGFSNA